MADGKVVIDTSLNNKGFTRGVNNLKGELGGLSSVVKRLGGVIVAAFSVKALVGFGKAAIELGSNVAEVQNVVDVAFGDMSYKIEDFAETSIQNFGMSKLAAKKTASTYMAMAKGMGMADEAASDMAISLTGLSGDVASFFNISQELADVKLKSVFTGETETLKDLGVVMTQTNLKAYALSKGINKNLESMTQGELVSLRYGFVMEQLSLAHGDFARTSDSWANQTRILSEQWKEFMSIIGQALITVLRPLVVTLNQVVSGVIDAANTINSVVTTLFGGTSTQMQQTQQDASGVGDAIEGSVDSEGDLTDAVEQTNKAAKKSLTAFDEIYKLAGDTATGGEIEIPSIPSIGGGGGITTTEGEKIEGLSEKLTAMLESLRSGFQELMGWVKDFFAPFKESWDAHGATVITAAKNAFADIIGLLRSVGEAFMAAWSGGSGVTILTTIQGIVRGIMELAGTLAERFRTAWEENENGKAIVDALLKIFNTVLNTIKRIVEATVNWAKNLDLEPLLSSLRKMLEAFGPVLSIIGDTIAGIWETIVLPFLKWLIEVAIPFILDKLTELFDFLAEHPWIIELLTDLVIGFIAAWALGKVITGVAKLVGSLSPLKILLGVIAGLVIAVVSAWSNMSPLERASAVVGILTIAIVALAVAMGALSGIGGALIAAASIAAGIALAVAAVHDANKRASSIHGGGFTGGSGFGGGSSYALSTANLPHLAQGAVIPANREFLAVLGDQKSGTNYEVPDAKLRQLIREETAGMGGTPNIKIEFRGSLSQLGRVLKPHIEAETKRVGVSLVTG